MKLKRIDKQYIEIEEFEDYELTPCVTYEMMIRDDDEMKQINTTIQEVKKLTENISSLKEKMISDTTKYAHLQTDITNQVKDIYFLFNNISVEAFNINQLKSLYTLPTLTDTNKIFLNEYINERESSMTYEDDTLEEYLNMEQSFDDSYYDFGTLELEGYSVKTKSVVDDAFNFYFDVDKYGNGHRNPKVATLLGYVPISEVTITPYFKRHMDFKWVHMREAKIEVNLALSKNELLLYIAKIKDDFDKDNSIIAIPIEIIDEELQKADNLVCNDKGKCFDPRKILSTQQKMADMFYIYDCLKAGYTQRKIQNDVYNYYADKGMENITLDPETLRKYRNIAIEYIDNGRYKEMLTGVNIDEF